jgi:hypothetical protein
MSDLLQANRGGDRPPGRTGTVWRRCRYGWCVVAALLLALGCGNDEAGRSPEGILKQARKTVGLSSGDGRLVSLRTVAICTGPKGRFTTEVHSAADGRVMMRQDFPNRAWFWVYVEGDTGTMLVSGGDQPAPADAKWRTLAYAQEFHFAALAPETRHEIARVEPEARFAGEQAVALLWIDELGGENRSYYRRSDALPLGLEFTNHQGGPPLVTVRFSDWRASDGPRLFREADVVNGGNEFHFSFTSIEVNPPLESLFNIK